MASLACRYCGKNYNTNILAIHEGNCAQNPAKISGTIPPPPPPIVAIKEPDFDQRTWAWNNPEVSDEVALAVQDEVVVEVEPEPEAIYEGMFKPTFDPYFVIPTDMGRKLDRVLAKSEKHPCNILLSGPQGAGKTSLAMQLAAKGDRWCYIAACVTMQEAGQWFGTQGVSPERGTFYIMSQFIRACETEGCVVVLDDMNRVENPKVLNPLFPLLDDRRWVYLEDLLRNIKVAPRVIFVGTVNEGYQFQGTDPIDLALNDRFDKIAVQYPPGQQINEILIRKTGVSAQTAGILGNFASSLANHQTDPIFISMRQMLSIAEDVVLGGSIRDAVTFSMAANLSEDQLEKVAAVLQTLLQDDYMAMVPDWRPWGA